MCFHCDWHSLQATTHDVVGCHGEDGGSSGNTREWTTGTRDVHVGVRQRSVGIHTVLRDKEHIMESTTSLPVSAERARRRSCEHLVQPRGHDEERRRGLVSSGRGRRGQVVALQDVLVLRLALVELVVLPPDSGHFEDVAQNLSSCTTDDKTVHHEEPHPAAPRPVEGAGRKPVLPNLTLVLVSV